MPVGGRIDPASQPAEGYAANPMLGETPTGCFHAI